MILVGNQQFEIRRQELVTRQRAERKALSNKLEQRQSVECAERQNRYRTGFMGFWDRLSGTHNQIKKQNEQEAHKATIRDRTEKDVLITRHLEQRKRLNAIRVQERNEYQTQKQELKKNVQTYKTMLSEIREKRLDDYSQERRSCDASVPSQIHNRDRFLDR